MPEAQALCVASHLHYCSTCRSRVAELTAVGDVMFQNLPEAPVASEAFDDLMARIEAHESTSGGEITPTPMPPARDSLQLPPPVRKLAGDTVDNLRWQQMGRHLRYSRLNSTRERQETALFFIRAGGHVPRHGHQGEEITVILKGSFSDQDDQYHVGDFIVRNVGEKHQPVASQDEDCLCLSTLEAPISMTNWLYRLLMPLVRLRSA